ncbi:type II 3-dehydroquinate dehydratase [Candidatus Riflebacteria bacterium]
MGPVHVINGPNLNLLGIREQKYYGNLCLKDIEKKISQFCKKKKIQVNFFQSNHEGEIIDYLQKYIKKKSMDYFVINPGGLTHSSVSLRDTMELLRPNVVEVHLSHIFKREKFRQQLITTGAANGLIAGLGYKGYLLAIEYFYLQDG